VCASLTALVILLGFAGGGGVVRLVMGPSTGVLSGTIGDGNWSADMGGPMVDWRCR
jgi:hypothetical protein